MKTIIAGSRAMPRNDVEESDMLYTLTLINADDFTITEVVSGTAKGADRLGECWADSSDKPIRKFPADWKKHGLAAGPIRNKQMAKYADACIVFWDGKSRGAKNMIQEALNHNLKLFVFTWG